MYRIPYRLKEGEFVRCGTALHAPSGLQLCVDCLRAELRKQPRNPQCQKTVFIRRVWR